MRFPNPGHVLKQARCGNRLVKQSRRGDFHEVYRQVDETAQRTFESHSKCDPGKFDFRVLALVGAALIIACVVGVGLWWKQRSLLRSITLEAGIESAKKTARTTIAASKLTTQTSAEHEPRAQTQATQTL